MAHFARLMMLTQTGKLAMFPPPCVSKVSALEGVLTVSAKTMEKIVDSELLLTIKRMGLSVTSEL